MDDRVRRAPTNLRASPTVLSRHEVKRRGCIRIRGFRLGVRLRPKSRWPVPATAGGRGLTCGLRRCRAARMTRVGRSIHWLAGRSLLCCTSATSQSNSSFCFSAASPKPSRSAKNRPSSSHSSRPTVFRRRSTPSAPASPPTGTTTLSVGPPSRASPLTPSRGYPLPGAASETAKTRAAGGCSTGGAVKSIQRSRRTKATATRRRPADSHYRLRVTLRLRLGCVPRAPKPNPPRRATSPHSRRGRVLLRP